MNKFFSRRGNKRGFTLIELLVVVLILAILMAVALPLYLSAVADSEKKTCRANMQTIANAVRAYQVKNRDDSTLPALADLNDDLGATPICPSNGTYSLAATPAPYTVSCTVADHQDTDGFTPGVDND